MSGIVPVFGSVKASDAGEDLTSRDVVLIESAAPRSTVTTDIPSLREDGVEDIFFRYEDTMTHYSVDKMADAAGEDADVELKQNREDISLRLDGETRDDLSERYQEWVPVQTPEPQERLILTHKEVEQKTSMKSSDANSTNYGNKSWRWASNLPKKGTTSRVWIGGSSLRERKR